MVVGAFTMPATSVVALVLLLLVQGTVAVARLPMPAETSAELIAEAAALEEEDGGACEYTAVAVTRPHHFVSREGGACCCKYHTCVEGCVCGEGWSDGCDEGRGEDCGEDQAIASAT